MAKLPGNSQLLDAAGRPLRSLLAINQLDDGEKEALYVLLVPLRLRQLLGLAADGLHNTAGERLTTIIAPSGLALLRIEVRARPDDADTVFFLELADTQYHQMELSFCIICDPAAPRYDVDVDENGRRNWFASRGRNLPEELRALKDGLFPNQTRRGLRLFVEFFPLLERFTDALGMEMIVAEPLSYDNAIRYEKIRFRLPARQATDDGDRPGIFAGRPLSCPAERFHPLPHARNGAYRARAKLGHSRRRSGRAVGRGADLQDDRRACRNRYLSR
jgi:hypothetical protein